MTPKSRRQIREYKAGVIAAAEPPALKRLGIDPDHWTAQVKGIGSAYWRMVGSADDLAAKAKAIGQKGLKGVGFARCFSTR